MGLTASIERGRRSAPGGAGAPHYWADSAADRTTTTTQQLPRQQRWGLRTRRTWWCHTPAAQKGGGVGGVLPPKKTRFGGGGGGRRAVGGPACCCCRLSRSGRRRPLLVGGGMRVSRPAAAQAPSQRTARSNSPPPRHRAAGCAPRAAPIWETDGTRAAASRLAAATDATPKRLVGCPAHRELCNRAQDPTPLLLLWDLWRIIYCEPALIGLIGLTRDTEDAVRHQSRANRGTGKFRSRFTLLFSSSRMQFLVRLDLGLTLSIQSTTLTHRWRHAHPGCVRRSARIQEKRTCP